MKISTRHFWMTGALIAALATWAVAQAPIPGSLPGIPSFSDGALATPGVAFGSGAATGLGMYVPAANSLGFVTGGVLRLRILSGGANSQVWLPQDSAAVQFGAAQDAGLSRIAAGSLAVGSGTLGDTTGTITSTNDRTVAVAVASLPSCGAGTEGTRAAVNNSNATSFTSGIGAVVVGGGSTHVPVICDGTSWRIG